MTKLSYGKVLFLYLVFFLVLLFPYWLKGEVIAPHTETVETGAIDALNYSHIQNRKFGDFPTSYIPEIAAHLKSPRSGWLALWTPHTELGRPLYQISGFSPAYFPSWVLSHVTDDPYRFITVLSLGTCFLCGVFLLLLCREMKLAPLAGFLVAISTAASPFFMYWLTFPMFLATWCWSIGIMYAIARMARTQDLLSWSVLAFSSYSILMTGYPQPVVFNAYLIAGFGIYVAYRCWQSNRLQRLKRFVLLCICAILIGGAFALPSYVDLAHTAADSMRLSVDPLFFTRYLPRLDSPLEAMRFGALGIFPEAFGNPISPSFPFSYDGLSVTPIIIFLGALGLLLAWRQTWGWWLAAATIVALTFSPSLYVVGVKYLGFHLSPINPLGIIILPVTMICGLGANALYKRGDVKDKNSHAVIIAASITATGLAVAVGFAITNGISITWSAVVVPVAVVLLLAAQVDKTRPNLLVAAVALVVAYTAFPLMLRQDPAQVATSSPLVEAIRANLPADSRYAVARPGIPLIPPNLNARLGIPSVHTYNNLASNEYHQLMGKLGFNITSTDSAGNRGAQGFNSDSFWMSNIGLVLSPTPETDDNLHFLEKNGDIYFHHVLSRMGYSAEFFVDPSRASAGNIELTNPRATVIGHPRKVLDMGDVLELDNLSGKSSLLVLSQKFHRDWHVETLTSSGWAKAESMRVNGIFQGVLLPRGAVKLRLTFSPFTQYAWVGHVFWISLILVFAFKAVRTVLPVLLRRRNEYI